jgi:hypothetical protein
MQWVVVEMGYVRDVCRWISVLDPASAAGMTVSFSSPSCSRRIATTGNSTLRAKWYSNHSSHWSLYIMHFPWFFGCFLTATAGHQAWTRTSWQFWSGSANERARTLQEGMNRNCHLGMKSERSGHLLCQVTRNPKPWPCTKTIRWGGHMKNGKYWAYFWAISVWRAWECWGSEKIDDLWTQLHCSSWLDTVARCDQDPFPSWYCSKDPGTRKSWPCLSINLESFWWCGYAQYCL